MGCYACDQEAARNCPRCGNFYCPAHGSEPESGGLCSACADPVNAAPSSAVFRASLFALLIASVVALWLLVRPPALPGESPGVSRPEPANIPAPTAGPTARPEASPATPAASSTPSNAAPTPGGTGGVTPTPGATPIATPAPVETPVTEYTVLEDDTWYSIAAEFGVDAETLAAANGRTLDDFVVIGETLVIP